MNANAHAVPAPVLPDGTAHRTTTLMAVLTSLLLAACSSLPTDVQRTESHTLEDTQDTRIALAVQPLLDEHPKLSGFHTLSDGSEAFEKRLLLIKGADKSIDAQYYIWHMDLTGNSMYNRLLDAADRGVRVRILLDDLDTAGKDETLQLIDAHPNVEVRVYNPFSNRDFRSADFITDTRRVDHRMHTKTLTVDNHAAIFGGRNIGDEYFSAAQEVGFSDMDALAIGPIVGEISSQFDLFWNSKWVYPITAFAPDELISEAEIASFREQSNQHMEDARNSEYGHIIKEVAALEGTSVEGLNLNWSDWRLAYDLPSNVEGKEITAETNLAPNLKKGMQDAQNELLIVSPYFVPGPEFTQFLTQRVADGITVKILTNSLQSNDVSLVHAGYMRYREDLLAGGVELYEFKAVGNLGLEQKLEHDQIEADKASLHAKFFGFDKKYLFIGSFNLDARSRVLNTELGAYFASPEDALRMASIFDNDIMRIAYRVKLDEEGELEWFTQAADGEIVRVDHEPDTSFWKRFNTRILSPIVPESQL